MSRILIRALAAAVSLAAVGALAQAPAAATSTPPAAAVSPAPSPAPPASHAADTAAGRPAMVPIAPRAVPDGVASADKSCIAAGRKLDRERHALASAQDELAHYGELQRGCTSKSVCARYAAAMSSLDKRIARHELRIGKFVENRDRACKT